MWFKRGQKEQEFLQAVLSLQSQVLIVRGARQVGKTSFILHALKELPSYPQLLLNLAVPRSHLVDGLEYFGRDYFGTTEGAEEFLKNLTLTYGNLENLKSPLIVFIDEADRHPVSLEAIQKLAGLSKVLKIIYTGSNLENIQVKNAATGRKRYWDLYPLTFQDFLKAYSKDKELHYLQNLSLKDPLYSEHYHQLLSELFDLYLRLGGMPRIWQAFLEPQFTSLPTVVSDLVTSIEENVKVVLGEKTALYEYEDILRKLALFSMDTFKFSRLQVQHAGRSEAKKLVNKTVGARVAHKIRLFDTESDLSKYILFDPGVMNYLLNGSDLLHQKITTSHLALQYETIVGNEIIATLPSRDDLLYWKSKRGAQVEYILKSPAFIAIDVKTNRGDLRSLNSAAIYEEELDAIVKMSREQIYDNPEHLARLPNQKESRKIHLIRLPHYLAGRVRELLLYHSPT